MTEREAARTFALAYLRRLAHLGMGGDGAVSGADFAVLLGAAARRLLGGDPPRPAAAHVSAPNRPATVESAPAAPRLLPDSSVRRPVSDPRRLVGRLRPPGGGAPETEPPVSVRAGAIAAAADRAPVSGAEGLGA